MKYIALSTMFFMAAYFVFIVAWYDVINNKYNTGVLRGGAVVSSPGSLPGGRRFESGPRNQ